MRSLVRCRPDLGLQVFTGVARTPVHSIVVGNASLPSGDAALRLVRGNPEAIIDVGSSMLLRGSLVALGLAIAGFRGMQLLTGSAAAVLAIEAGVLVWAWGHRKEGG
jgi:hypothetical protein